MNGPKNTLKKLRLENKMSGVQIAEAANITPQYYYELERGEKRLNEDLIRKFADIFGCTTDQILGRSEYRNYPHTQAAHIAEDEASYPITQKDLDYIEKLLKKARENIKKGQ